MRLWRYIVEVCPKALVSLCAPPLVFEEIGPDFRSRVCVSLRLSLVSPRIYFRCVRVRRLCLGLSARRRASVLSCSCVDESIISYPTPPYPLLPCVLCPTPPTVTLDL